MFRVKPWCLLRCWSLWASHELCVWPLQLTFWTGFQKMWFSIRSGFSSSSDCWLFMMRPKNSFALLSIFTFLEVSDRSGGALVLYRITSVMWAQLFDVVGHEVRRGLHTHLCKVAWEGMEAGGSINLKVSFGGSGWFSQGGLALQAVSLLYELLRSYSTWIATGERKANENDGLV